MIGNPVGCDVDDIICQLRVLASLKTLQENMGKENFLLEFPELEGMDVKIKDKIASQRGRLSDAIKTCDVIDPDEIPPEILAELEEKEEE